uniref:Uncharacterized protein n=1 Tax=Triticum urartu TaxID=4572 RepID=A0A8R7V128_TRIUA
MVLIADSPFTWQWMQISWVFRSVVLPVAGLYLLPHSSICGGIQVFVHVQRPAGPYAPIVLVRIVPVIQKVMSPPLKMKCDLVALGLQFKRSCHPFFLDFGDV